MKTNEKFYGFTNYLVFPAVITRRPQLLKKIIQLYFPDITIGELRTEKTHPENFVPMLKQKSVRMDIKTTDSEERRIIAEMIAYEDGAIEVRIQNYIAADYVDQRKRGEAYRETETIALIISAFKVNEDEKAISRYRFINPDNPGKRLKSSPELLVIFYNGNEEGLSDEQKDFLYEKVKNMGATIIGAKGRTHYGIATCVCSLADAILNQRPTIAPVTSPLQGEYGIERVSLSIPSIVGVRGIEHRLEETWSDKETEMLRMSAKTLDGKLRELEEVL